MWWMLLGCSSIGPGTLVERSANGEIVVAAPTWKERFVTALSATGSAKISQDALATIRKVGGKVLVDRADQLSGLEKDTVVVDLSKDEGLRELLSGTDEKGSMEELQKRGITLILLHRDIRASMDRDSKVISRLYNHDFLENVLLDRVGKNYLLYTVGAPVSFSPDLATACIHWVREQIAGRKPAPFPPIPSETQQWVLMMTLRGQGEPLAVTWADGKTLDQALDEAASDLEMMHRRYREILGFPMLSTTVDHLSFEIHRVVELAEIEDVSDESLNTFWEMGIDGAFIQQMKVDEESGRRAAIKEGALPGAEAAIQGMTTPDELLKNTAKTYHFDSIRPWRDENNRLFSVHTVSFREVPGVPKAEPIPPVPDPAAPTTPPNIAASSTPTPSTVAPLFRGTLPVPIDFVTQTSVAQTFLLMGEWYLQNLQPDGSVIYKFWPEDNRFSSDYNHVRHELATWNLWQAWTLDPRPEFLEGAKRAQDWTLKSLVERNRSNLAPWEKEALAKASPELRAAIEEEGMAYYTYGDNTKLGSVVVGLFGMIELAKATNDHQYDTLMRKFGRFIELMQDPNGKFRGYHVPPEHSSFGASNDIVPGEAALALVYLSEYFQDPSYLVPLKSFFSYYMPWYEERAARIHPDRPWPAFTYENDTRLELVQFGPWTVMAANAYVRNKPEEKAVAEFGLKVGRWMIETYEYSSPKVPYPDYVGGYFKFEGELPAMQAFCYSEGTAAAYDLALRAAPEQAAYFEQHTRESLRFGVQMQHDAFDTYGYSRPFQVIGGVAYAMNEPKVRIDYVYHAQSSFYQWLMASRRDPNLPAMAKAAPTPQYARMMELMGYPAYRKSSQVLATEVLPEEATQKKPDNDGE